MKKWSVVLIVALLIIAAIIVAGKNAPGPDLKVISYFRKLYIPFWTPLSMGNPSGSLKNPVFLTLKADRYLIMIVSVPRRRISFIPADAAQKCLPLPAAQHDELLAPQDANQNARSPDDSSFPDQFAPQEDFDLWPAIDRGNPGDPNFPEFTLILKQGWRRKARNVVAWPKEKYANMPYHFRKVEKWSPKPNDKPNKRYYLAAVWRISEKDAIGPFQLQMDNDEPIEVPTSKHDFYHKWQ